MPVLVGEEKRGRCRDASSHPEERSPLSRYGVRDMADHPVSERPLRADAERNRRRILAAASDVFAERGLDASLDEVAAAAGVGIGTVYRRFPDKEALIDELFESKLRAVE